MADGDPAKQRSGTVFKDEIRPDSDLWGMPKNVCLKKASNTEVEASGP
jgi:hypothetical protein